MLARVVALCGVAALGVTVSVTPAAAASGTITTVTPTASVVGTTVEIDGTGFTGATDVAFGSVDAGAPNVIDDSHLTVTVPLAATSSLVHVTLADSSVVDSPSSFDVIPVATMSASSSAVVWPAFVTLRATLMSGGVAVSGQAARLQWRVVGTSTWLTSSVSRTTDSSGQVAFAARPIASTVYRVTFDSSPAFQGVQTSSVTVGMRPTLAVSIPVVVPILTPLRFTGVVRPAARGAVVLQKYVSSAWHTIVTAHATSTGAFAFGLAPLTVKGTTTYRVLRPADFDHLAVSTRPVAVRAVDRTLRSGMTGSDVSFLQRRLMSLHYDIPAVTGVFNYDTLHAVIAFEKVQKLTRDGVVSSTVWVRLGRPVLPHLLHPLAGVAAVEVDLTKQVLYYAVNGVIQRILDVSTGGGYTYVGSDGQLATAITPTGHFHVLYKVNHWVTSKLGTLYRPAYFNNSGYAIHGEGAVPAYPVSHGCVRITVPAMDRMYAKLTIGLSVWIYRT